MAKKKKYKLIDQQWVATSGEADDLERRLASHARRQGLLIGRKPSGKGFLITVEELVDEEDG